MNIEDMSSKTPRRKLRGLILIGICLLAIIPAFYIEENVRGKWTWEKLKREWEAKGEKFDAGSLIPPPVPDDQNFALTPIVFTSYSKVLTRDGKAIPEQKRDENFVDRLRIETISEGSTGPTNGTGDWATARMSDLKVWQNYYRTLPAIPN